MKTKLKVKYKTANSYTPVQGRVFEMASQTVKGEALTIKQLFEKSQTTGDFQILPPKEAYVDCEDVEKISQLYTIGLDITDIHAHKAHIKELEKNVDQIIKNKEKAALAAAKEKIQKQAEESVRKGSEADALDKSTKAEK